MPIVGWMCSLMRAEFSRYALLICELASTPQRIGTFKWKTDVRKQTLP